MDGIKNGFLSVTLILTPACHLLVLISPPHMHRHTKEPLPLSETAADIPLIN